MADMISMLLHGINILLSVGLLVVYIQNYRKMKSRYTIGLMLFVLLFLIQGIMGLYFDMSMVMYADAQASAAATALEVVKAVSFAILLWISLE